MTSAPEEANVLEIGDIGKEIRPTLSVQSYESRPSIAGVRFLDLRTFSDEVGDFCEVVRLTADGRIRGLEEYKPAQISFSLVLPGAIKAWHIHFGQDDLWFVPPSDRMLIGLHDLRQGSSSYQMTMRFVLGAGRARMLVIPRGVAHGLANRTSMPATVFYFANRQFDADNPDERRIPFDHLGAAFWEMKAE